MKLYLRSRRSSIFESPANTQNTHFINQHVSTVMSITISCNSHYLYHTCRSITPSFPLQYHFVNKFSPEFCNSVNRHNSDPPKQHNTKITHLTSMPSSPKKSSSSNSSSTKKKRNTTNNNSKNKQKRSSPTPWSKEDDKLLIQYAQSRTLSWRQIAEEVFKNKFTSGQCHQHWNRVLSNSINKDEWLLAEELKMLKFIAREGTQSWASLSKYMGNGRIDIQCRQ
jgi:hypothetical protein